MRYLKSFNENMALAKSIVSKKMEAFDKLKSLLSKNLGYIGKFTDYLMSENIPYSDLENLYKELIDLKNKQKPIDISLLKYEQVIDKIQNVRNDLSVNSLIQQFPSEQKELARELLKSNYNLLLQASKKENLDTLLTKISRYKTKDELKNALKLFGKTAFNDKEQIKEYLKTSKSNISFENENVMVVKVNSLEDIQKLGSDTSWCILSSHMWNSYTRGRYQFIIYDFRKDEWDPFFKIGFTLNKDFSIHAAHDILDGPARSNLSSLFNEQEIKFSSVIPKAEAIDVTKEMIDGINTRTSLTTLNNYADNVSTENLLGLIKKAVSVVGDTLTDGKRKLIQLLLNRYFADVEYVTDSDLQKIDPKITKFQFSSNFLKGKRVTDKPNFNSDYLNPDIAIKMLDYWKDESLISEFATTSIIYSLVKIPGAHFMYQGDEIRFSESWNKEKVTKISDKVNELWESEKWKGLLNDYGKRSFNTVYVVLNYVLGRKDLVKPEAISNLDSNSKVDYAYLLEMPIEFSPKDYLRDISKWAAPLVVKKDYPDVKLYLEKPTIIKLVDRLIDNQLYFKIGKKTKDSFINKVRSLPDSPGKKKILDTLSKFRSTARVGNSVESDDNKIKIELF
jgi:hypothetical protein